MWWGKKKKDLVTPDTYKKQVTLEDLHVTFEFQEHAEYDHKPDDYVLVLKGWYDILLDTTEGRDRTLHKILNTAIQEDFLITDNEAVLGFNARIKNISIKRVARFVDVTLPIHRRA